MEPVQHAPARLTPLREELSIHPSAPGVDGDPRWVIEDPTTHRFYELDWSGFEILNRWSLPPEEIVAQINQSTSLTLGLADIEAFYEFLAKAQLLQPETGGVLYEQWQKNQRSPIVQLLHSYLFFRVPLIRPDKLLGKISPLFSICYRPLFWYLLFSAAFIGLFLVMRQWESFIGTFSGYTQWQDWVWFAVAMVISKCGHELGHALSAHRYGCRVPSMGVAFLVMWPVLYTDTNEAWKLQSRRSRLVISASGMAAELALASIATFAWLLTPEGPLRSALFFLASTAWILTLAINLNPFMRFDGYFLLADWLRQPNLHGRSFDIARWWLRKHLFGLDDQPPETVSPRLQRFMIWFAIGTWLYRFFLFLGIALMVYHLFFKLLGVFLMVLELVWFIGRPIYGELKIWWQRRREIRHQGRALVPLMLLVLLLSAVFVPWSHTVRAPALIKPEQTQTFYADTAGIVSTLNVARGDRVKKGQVLLELHSPDLAYEVEQAKKEIDLLQWQLDRQTTSDRLMQQGALIRERLAQAYTELRRIESQQAKLRYVAPYNGHVVELAEHVTQHQWVAEQEPLLALAQEGAMHAVIIVEEADLGRLSTQNAAELIPQQPELAPIVCRVLDVESLAVEVLKASHLASIYGGPIAANVNPNGELVPDQSVYRINASQCGLQANMSNTLDGEALREYLATAHLASKPYSIAEGFWKRLQGILIRETGF
ncbi:MAG: biotin/lipoyl-binding protein [Pontibacterium sp.]